MPFPFAGLAGASAGLNMFGGLMQQDAQKEANKEIQRLFGKQANAVNAAYLQQALQQLLAGGRLIDEGYNQGLDELTRTQGAQRQELKDMEVQRAADVTQRNLGSGLARTTAHPMAMRGVQYDTNRALAQLSANMAQQRSQMAVQRGLNLSQNRSQIASLYPAWANARNAIRSDKINMIAGAAGQPNMFQQLGGGLGGMWGLAAGGGFG